ncbi:MAG TPA: tRNA (adenosine(37)-N6)-threonylcarbamoyltransferase complex dimerization subunit type 1 TsaB [Stellaceae bacterium]|nr:tRNA (adenosine(37)-N6)-threonylcarbamoyltransferase complex dimerization subunit type 1 TsaB [Stellaceae bacterium]
MSAAGAPVVLAFDTAGSACSVALGRGEAVLAHERRAMRYGHAEALLPMIDRVATAAGLAPDEIDMVAVTVGPGGFTGIRAGLAAAHGLALAAGARLVGISSFAAVAAGFSDGEPRLLVALDSRRADLYVQLFGARRAPAGEPAAVPPERLAAWAGDGELAIAGDAVEAAIGALGPHRKPKIWPNSAPDALGVLAALRRWPDRTDPLARPLYLRPPDVSFPKAQRGTGQPA